VKKGSDLQGSAKDYLVQNSGFLLKSQRIDFQVFSWCGIWCKNFPSLTIVPASNADDGRGQAAAALASRVTTLIRAKLSTGYAFRQQA
jgi:hypothetical protein